MRAEHSWSLLDPKPVLLYLSKQDEYIVYWNGIAMTHSQALCMTMEFAGIFATPEMKQSMQDTFERIYYTGGFDTRAWDDIVRGGEVYQRQKKWMKDHLVKYVKDAEPKDALGWFDYSRARTSNGQPN